jgi:uncharacterized protein
MPADQDMRQRSAGARQGDAGAGRPQRLPWPVRVLCGRTGRRLGLPACGVAVETGLAVPGADGVTLRTDHYIPLVRGARPTLLVRCPYGRGFPWNYLYGGLLAGQGFHVVLQSVRGTGGSSGEFDPWQHEAQDGQATVAWLREQDWFSGALGTIGSSYLSYVQWALAQDPPPELRALAIQVGAYDLYEFLYRPGGALALEGALLGAASMLTMDRGFVRFTAALLGRVRAIRRAERTLPLIDSYRPALGGRTSFFEYWITHPDRADAYWDTVSAAPALDGLAVPVSLVTGWDDICLDQTLESYRRLVTSGGSARLTVGPWSHTSAFDRGLPEVFAEAVTFLREQLGVEPENTRQAPVRVFLRGREDWQDLAAWPPAAVLTGLHASGGGQLDWPGSEPRFGKSNFRYDPANPTPSTGGQSLNARAAGPVNNHKLESRPDVLIFTSEPLKEPLTVIGPVTAQVVARGSTPHFDLFARLCDVDPSGVSRNVCDGLVRHQPGSADEAGWSLITVPMSATAHEFGAGHRVRLQISGGAHPRYLRNPGTGEPLATATRLVPVDIEIRHAAGDPATLVLPVVSPGR